MENSQPPSRLDDAKHMLIGLGVTTALSLFFGSIGDNVNDQYQEAGIAREEFEDLYARVDTYQEDLRAAETLNIDLAEQFGRACLDELDVFTAGNDSADTPESDVVTDVIDDEDQPCGTDRSEVRVIVSNVRDASQTLYDLYNFNFDAASRRIQPVINDLRQDKQNKNWFYAIPTSLFGPLIVLLAKRQDRAEKRREEKYQSLR